MAEIGTRVNEALQTMSYDVDNSLQARIREILPKARIAKVSPLISTPEKGYTAKSEAQINYEDNPLGSGIVNVLVFQLGDGTGNQQDFSIPGIPAAWTPRKKKGFAEVYLSLGTYLDGEWYERLTSLSGFTLDREGMIQKYADLTLPKLRVVKDFKTYALTFDNETNYGNPHAVVLEPNNRLADVETTFQIGAFLLFPENQKSLEEIRQVLQ
jgi:hypothetical protein